MKLHSPQVEKEIRRRVSEEIKASPRFRKESREHKRPKQFSSAAFLRAFPTAFLAMALWQTDVFSPQARVAIISLWAIFLVFSRSSALINELFHSRDLPALMALPTPNETIFRWVTRRFWRGNVWSLIDFSIAYLMLGLREPGSNWLPAIVAGSAQAGLVILISASLVMWRRSGLYSLLFGVAVVMMIGASILYRFMGSAMLSALESVAPLLNSFLPFGSISLLAKKYYAGDQLWAIALLFLLITAEIALLRIVWNRLNYLYRSELDQLPGPAMEAAVDGPGSPASARPEPYPPAGDPVSVVVGNLHIAPPFEAEGMLERCLCRLLTGREKIVLEFFAGDTLGWTRSWRRGAKFVFISLFVAWLVHWMGTPAAALTWLLVAMGAILLLMIFPTRGFGNGFARTPLIGVTIPLYAGFPIAFGEIARLIYKCAMIRLLAAIPVLLFFIWGMCWLLGWPLGAGLLLAVKGIYVFAAALPSLIAIRFSSQSNDSQRITLRMFLFLTLTIPFALAFFGLGLSLLLVTNPVAWIFAILLPIPAFASFRLYERWFNRGSFDLVQPTA